MPHHNDKNCRSYKGPDEPAARWEPAVARRRRHGAVSHSSSGAQAYADYNGRETCGEPGWMHDEFRLICLRPVYTCDFRCDFDAILMRFCVRNLPQPTPHGFLVA